uniref:Tubby C-terminal domain-containing protein n=1 Tax=Alexandrium andersonii TaxID=327968 RepID=A0A7S2FBY2_9DINO
MQEAVEPTHAAGDAAQHTGRGRVGHPIGLLDAAAGVAAEDAARGDSLAQRDSVLQHQQHRGHGRHNSRAPLFALIEDAAHRSLRSVEGIGAVALAVVLVALLLLLSLAYIAAANQPKQSAANTCRSMPQSQPSNERVNSAPVAVARPAAVEDPFHMRSARGPCSSPMSGTLSPGQGGSPDPDKCLCPDLVVPPNCECILLIPTATLGQEEFNITDTHGNTVLSVEPRPAPPRSSGGPTSSPLSAFSPTGSPLRSGAQAGSRPQRLVLNSIYNDLLAQCGPAPSKRSEPPEFHLLRASGEYFAKLTCSESRKECMLVTKSGARLHFWGSPADHALNVTSGSGRVCATTEPQTLQRYKLRVAPLMDVGLVLCGVLCIDHLA